MSYLQRLKELNAAREELKEPATRPIRELADLPPALTEVITPEIAAEMLTHNIGNRRPNKRDVKKLARYMTDGLWMLNGSTIVFDWNGVLRDGQHRLLAVVYSGVTIKCQVSRGVDPACYPTIDDSRVRGAHDVIQMRDDAPANIRTVASLSRAALIFMSHHAIDPDRRMVTDFEIAHPYTAEAARLATSVSKTILPSAFGALLFLANERRAYDDAVAQFTHGVATGAGLPEGDPRLALLHWARTARSTGRTMNAGGAFAATIRAWNGFVRGESLLQIKALKVPATMENTRIAGFIPPPVPTAPRAKSPIPARIEGRFFP